MKKRVEKSSIDWEAETKSKYLGSARVNVVLFQRYGIVTNSMVRHSVLFSRDDCLLYEFDLSPQSLDHLTYNAGQLIRRIN